MRQYTRAELDTLRKQILDRGWTIESLAAAAKVRESLVTEIMKGTIRPTLAVRQSLAEALGINPSLLD